MATSMALGEGNLGLVGGRMTYSAQTVTIGTQDVAVTVGGTSSKIGDSAGFDVGVTGTMTATFAGTRLCHIRGVLEVESADNTVTDTAICVTVGGTEVVGSDSPEQDADTDNAPVLLEVDTHLLVSNGDVIGLGLINGTDTADVVTIVAAAMDGNVADFSPETGWFTITG